MATGMRFEFQFQGKNGPNRHTSDETARRILLLGNFSGTQADVPLTDRSIRRVDAKSLDNLMKRSSPKLRLELSAGTGLELEFSELEDFHPDALFSRLPVFDTLRSLRRKLEDSSTYAQAAAELKRGLGADSAPSISADDALAPRHQPDQEASGTLFESLLGQPLKPTDAAPQIASDSTQVIIRHIVAPHVKAGVDQDEQRQLLFAVDDSIAQTMRAILHDPAFQALEAVWRGLHWLLTRIEDGSEIEVFMLDAALADLTVDLKAVDGRVEDTALQGLLNRELGIPDAIPWSLIVALYRFGDDAEGLQVLEMLGSIASDHGALCCAQASPALLGCVSLSEMVDPKAWQALSAPVADAWAQLRRSRFAEYIGLALPRFLLRRPYGARSDPIDGFLFEELIAPTAHEAYLWGNAALLCAAAIAQRWVEDEVAQSVPTLLDLPYHLRGENGDRSMQACAEVYLSEGTGRQIACRGLMPLLSVRDRNQIVLPWLLCIAQSEAGLVS